jgi:hypothetical protein
MAGTYAELVAEDFRAYVPLAAEDSVLADQQDASRSRSYSLVGTSLMPALQYSALRDSATAEPRGYAPLEDTLGQADGSRSTSDSENEAPLFRAHSFRESLQAQYEHAIALGDLAALEVVFQEFLCRAKQYGQVIISERHLPVRDKSIKPVGLGGTAGGAKYVVNELLFKFAEDVPLPDGSFLYGGPAGRDDEAAHKAAGHEAKATCVIRKLMLSQLRVPLLTVVDFHGVRLRSAPRNSFRFINVF